MANTSQSGNILQAILKPLLSGADAALEALKPVILSAASAANVRAVDNIKVVADSVLSRLPAAEAMILKPLVDTALSTQESAIVAALGGEEQALVNSFIARAEQIIANL